MIMAMTIIVMIVLNDTDYIVSGFKYVLILIFSNTLVMIITVYSKCSKCHFENIY